MAFYSLVAEHYQVRLGQQFLHSKLGLLLLLVLLVAARRCSAAAAGSAGVSPVEMRLINVDRVSFVKIAFRPSAS